MEDKRRKIMKAALGLFVRKGFDAATMGEVAAKAGIAKGTVYLYFKDKIDLYASLLSERITLLNQGVAEIAASDLPPTAKLEAIIRRNLEYIASEYPSSQFLVDTRAGHDPEVLKVIRTRISPRLEETIVLIAQVLKEGIACKEFREMNTFDVAMQIFSLVNFHLMKRAIDKKPINPARETESVKQLILNGITRR
jgi:AcrR family transcriptional regulator